DRPQRRRRFGVRAREPDRRGGRAARAGGGRARAQAGGVRRQRVGAQGPGARDPRARAGAGDRERYEELARSLGVPEAVHWLGVSRDVPLVLAAADALVFPSTYEA